MNIEAYTDPEQWATQQWGTAELGDVRRTERAVEMGAAIASNPSASLPEQMQSWGDLKAAYRLLSEADVTHERLSQGHWQQTQQRAAARDTSVVLFVQDTSELDYSRQRQTQDLGHIGNAQGRGLMLHSCLAVIPTPGNATLIGLAGQRVWRRTERKSNGETRRQRAERARESEVWAEMVEQIGSAPSSEQLWVSVGDRGSDVFSYLRRCKAVSWQCLFRACQDRKIVTTEGSAGHLMQHARAMTAMTQTTLCLRGRDGQPKQQIDLQVAWCAVQIVPPKHGAERHEAPQSGWCIRVWQAQTTGSKALEWVLFTTVAIDTAADALMQVDWYATRWIIEEYHKCLKTGCAIESRQLTTADALERLLGFLAIVAVRLLQLRTLARTDPALPAETVVPSSMIRILQARLHLPSSALSLAEFWHSLARLGGFIGRKSDGNPGWQTLWRGWFRLQDFCWGASLAVETQ